MRRIKTGIVRLSDHAYERWKLRVGPAKRSRVAEHIRRRIVIELKLGAEVNRTGALEIEVAPEAWAVCYPSFMGGWVVATIIKKGWDDDMEEKAEYGGDRAENSSRLNLAIEYFEDAVTESDEIIRGCACSEELKKQLLEQKGHFAVALDIMRREAGQGC